MGRARQVAEHHPKAVVERDRDADAVDLGVATALADEEAVVEDVAVAERRALREAGRAARVLNVDRVVGRQGGADRFELRFPNLLCPRQQLVPVARVQDHDALQVRQARAHLGDHRHVVGALEGRRGDQHLAARLTQRVLELRGPIGGVDVDHDHAGLGGRVLDQHPLGAVGAPDPEPVSRLDSRGDQSPRQQIDRRTELAICVSLPLLAGDQRLAVAESRDRAVEVRADRLLDQRHILAAARF